MVIWIERAAARSPRALLTLQALLYVVFLVCVGSACITCKGTDAPRERTRAAVLLVADGVRQADLACAAIALARKDVPLMDRCILAINTARRALLAAEKGVDAWDANAAGNTPCFVRDAAEALTQVLTAIRGVGAEVPPVVEDALRFAPDVAGACHER